MINWILKLTKVGGAVDKVRVFLDNKKTYLVGAATAVPALVGLILDFQQNGVSAFSNITNNRNYELLMVGLAMITGRAAISKAGNANKGPSDR